MSQPLGILIVDDEPMIRAVVGGFLKHGGFRVHAASNAEEALHALEFEEGIDLLLTDVQMGGGLTGFELAARVAEIRPGLPTIVMSGRLDAYAESKGGGLPFLAKPFSAAQLISRIRALVGSPEREGESRVRKHSGA
jgi:DNA-binding NtrC family response regulator